MIFQQRRSPGAHHPIADMSSMVAAARLSLPTMERHNAWARQDEQGRGNEGYDIIVPCNMFHISRGGIGIKSDSCGVEENFAFTKGA